MSNTTLNCVQVLVICYLNQVFKTFFFFFLNCETRQTSINDTFLSYPANGVRCASSSRSANWLSSRSLRTNPAPSREQSEVSHPP